MRLIHTKTLRFHDFHHSVPAYAILSHRWRPGEVSHKQFIQPNLRGRKTGFAKILAACHEARKHGLDYVWVDTCCIDKTSSAELGEAINSMFKWYQQAAVCFAYLDDVPARKAIDEQAPALEKPLTKSPLPRYAEDSFAKSKWFTRGWTLQELIAPRLLHFYDKDWDLIGKKHDMTSELQYITGVDRFILQGGSLEEVPAGRRMSWAVDRETTREEDIAYSLFGIFNVNLPLVYEEGPRAFLRLQEQILYKSNDHTLLAWRRSLGDGEQRMRGLLAESPRDFRHFRKHTPVSSRSVTGEAEPRDNLIRVRAMDSTSPRKPLYITSKGIEMTCGVQDLRPWAKGEILLFVLNCCFDGNPMRAAGIYLKRIDTDRYARIRVHEIADVIPEGRHIKTATIQAFLTTESLPESHLAEPWTTSYTIRRRLIDDATSGDAEGACRKHYTGAFYIGPSNSSFKIDTMFGVFSLVGMLVSGRDEQTRAFRIGPNDLKSDMVLPAPEGHSAVLVLQGDSDDLVLVVLATDNPETPSECWLDACYLPARLLAKNSLFISETVKEMKNWRGAPQQRKEVVMSGRRLKMSVSLSPTVVEGLPMYAVGIKGPRPVSYLHPPRLMVEKLTGGFIFTALTTALLVTVYMHSPVEVWTWTFWWLV